jgi:hypothetical protein
MVELAKINSTFRQTGGSCVLASYAIANNYFASGSIEEVFKDYCRHFKIAFSDWREAERKYAPHFHDQWNNKPNCKGYQVILDLHENSGKKSFLIARSLFDAKFHLNSELEREKLEKCLRCELALLNVTFNVPGGNFHSVTVFCDNGQDFVVRDTNRPGQVERIPGLTSLGILRDSVLYVAK